MAKLKEVTAQYEELKTALTSSLESISEKLKECSGDLPPNQKPTDRSAALATILSDVDKQIKKVATLKDVGGELLSTLDALDCKDTPRGKEIQATLDNLPFRFANLKEAIITKQQLFSDLLIQTLITSVEKNKGLLDNQPPVSLDRETLNDQIHLHRTILNNIDEHSLQIKTVTVPEKEITGVLNEKFEVLEKQAKKKSDDLDQTIKQLDAFHLEVYQIDSWYAYCLPAMKQDTMDLVYFNTKIDTFYGQRMEKMKHFEAAQKICKALLDDPMCGDKDKLSGLKTSLDEKWSSITDQLMKLIVTAAEREIESYSKWLEKTCKELEAADSPNADPEVVAKQFKEHQTFQDSFKKKHKSVSNTITKYKAMFKSLDNQEPLEIQTRWAAVQREMMAVSSRGEDRMSVLQEAQPPRLCVEVELDDTLEDWIEVDTVEGAGKAKKLKKLDKPKSSSTRKKESPKDKKSSKTDSKRKDHKSESKSESKKKDESKAKKDGKKSETPKKDGEKSKEEKKKDVPEIKENGAKSEKKESDASKSEPKKESSNSVPEETTSPTKKSVEETKSGDSSKSKESEKPKSSSEKGVPITFQRKGGRATCAYGIMVATEKDLTFLQLKRLLQPVGKIGIVLPYHTPSQRRRFVSLSTSKQVTEALAKLNNTDFEGQKIKVEKADVKIAGGEKTIFDKPSSSKHEKSSASSKVDGKKHAKDKKVLSLEEIKRAKSKERRERMKPVVKTFGRMRSDQIDNKRRQDLRNKKVILTLDHLRSEPRHARDVPNRVPRMNVRGNMMQRMPPHMGPGEPMMPDGFMQQQPGRMDPEMAEIIRERHRVRLEQEQLERERLQAERERIALQRERQKSEMQMIEHGLYPRGMKRTQSPTKDDGSFWGQPKRAAHHDRDDRFAEEDGRRPMRRPFPEYEGHLMRFNDQIPPNRHSDLNDRRGGDTRFGGRFVERRIVDRYDSHDHSPRNDNRHASETFMSGPRTVQITHGPPRNFRK